MDSARTLLNQVMETTKNKVIRTLNDCGAEHEIEMANIFDKIKDPFSAVGNELLLTSDVKKNFKKTFLSQRYSVEKRRTFYLIFRACFILYF